MPCTFPECKCEWIRPDTCNILDVCHCGHWLPRHVANPFEMDPKRRDINIVNGVVILWAIESKEGTVYYDCNGVFNVNK